MGGHYSYNFSNKSSYEVKVTLGFETKTMKAGNHAFFKTNTSTASVKYSPADKVYAFGGSGNISFHNK
jgi:hypothetical protein